MPRKQLIRTADHPYHIRARSNNKEWFELPLDECFEVFCNVIPIVCERYEMHLHAFILMNNHFHMAVSTPKLNLDECMHYFMGQTSRGLRKKTSRINHIYGGRYRWTLITNDLYYANCFRYIYQNPLRAKIVDRVEDYQFSTASGRGNKLTSLVTEFESHHSMIPKNEYDRASWLNIVPDPKVDRRTKIGLRKAVFEIGVDRNTKKAIDLRLSCAAVPKDDGHPRGLVL